MRGTAIETVNVIVPVYNAEKTLRRCVASVQRQKHADWRLILVDDGSTDDSGRICDAYAAKDARICAVHTPNQGPQKARMTGLEQIREGSAYCCFCDSDDALPSTALKRLYGEAVQTGAELVCGRMQRVCRGIYLPLYSKDACFSAPGIYDAPEITGRLYLSCFGGGGFPVNLWGKLYRVDVLKRVMQRIERFPQYFAEDLDVMIRLLPELRKLSVITDVVYAYSMGGGTTKYMPTFLSDNLMMYRTKMELSGRCTAGADVKKLVAIELKNIVLTYLGMCARYDRYTTGSLLSEVRYVCALDEVEQALSMLDCADEGTIEGKLINRDDAAVCAFIETQKKRDRIRNLAKGILLS